MSSTDQIVRVGRYEKMQEPSDALYSCFNTGGVECEVGEFFHGLVRMTKPSLVVETGTHKGISAAYFAQALRENGVGRLHTVEYIEENYRDSRRLLDRMALSDWVTMHLSDAMTVDLAITQEIDILLLDTEPQTRFAELLRFYPMVKEGGLILIHDLHPHMQQQDNEEHGFAWPYGPIPEEMNALIVSGKLRPVHFRTPRGLTLFYKVSPDDYVWPKKGSK